ncbi:hypothetical protein H7F33_07115 [Pedobacter sp. PAMC26386]|nr:hypothetical protein H7F33_07115 [Pedobacter sp. PAMC26386]
MGLFFKKLHITSLHQTLLNKIMAFRRSIRRARRSFSAGGFKVKKQLTSARRTASRHRKKAGTLTTIIMAIGGFLVYDKFIKK